MIEAVQVQNILKRSHENKLAHAFLLETNDIQRCYSDILSLLKHLNCPKEYDVNCSNECNICNLFNTNNLPSFITISPDGKNIKKQQILDMMDKFNTKPVFSKYNMYVIKEAEAFNASSANTLLKFLEEPEDNILGFFITTNKENVISTIRSRCQIVTCFYDIDESNKYNNEYLDEVKIYLNSIYKSNEDLLYNKNNMSGKYKDRKDWEQFFYTMLYYVRGCYTNKEKYKIEMFKNNSTINLIKIVGIIEDTLKHIKYNGNIDLILDKFVIEMRDCYE